MSKQLAQDAGRKPVTASTIVTVDVVIVRMIGNIEPELLLIQRAKEPYQGRWSLPGGKLADEDATLEAGALRELREETGFVLPASLKLKQLHSYGNCGRDPRLGR